ncbi:hypothetical protein SESBI_19968 [Sesbania bispinosa]|nr:hypothetical protein SESBI_19968 [Sesbania bispinosa]
MSDIFVEKVFVVVPQRDVVSWTAMTVIGFSNSINSCQGTLCSQAFADFVKHNFVCWGESIGASKGFKMSNSLKASRFPLCVVSMAATNQRIALLQQAEGPKSLEEMLAILQEMLDESSPVLVAARLDAEERRNNMRLREEQDAAYKVALEADQASNNGTSNMKFAMNGCILIGTLAFFKLYMGYIGQGSTIIPHGLGALAHTLDNIVPSIGAGDFAAIATATGIVAASFGGARDGFVGCKMATRIGSLLFSFVEFFLLFQVSIG